MRYLLAFALLAAMSQAVPVHAIAPAVDMKLTAEDISIQPALEIYDQGQHVRIYVRVHNVGSADGIANVSVRSGVGAAGEAGKLVGRADPLPVRAGGTGETWVDWVIPKDSFVLTAEASAQGDKVDNNVASTNAYPVAGSERDIFTPPDGREYVSLASSTDASSTSPSSTDASSTTPTTTEPEAVGWTSPVPPAAPSRAAASDDASAYTWVPYALILLGAVGFAWGMRGKRRQYVSAPRPAAPAPAAAKPRRRVARVAKPAAAAPKVIRRRAPRVAPPPPQI